MTVRDAPNPIVHRVTMNPENETRKAKTRLDEVLDEKEERAAKRYSAAELEKMALEAENEAARLRGEPPKHKVYGGEGMTDEEKAKEDERKQVLMEQAKALIEKGMEPRQVGQMLMGLTVTPTTAGYSPAQGMGFDDVMKLVTFVVGKRETDELKSIIASLDKKVSELAKGGGNTTAYKPLSPMEYAKQQKEYIDALKGLGLIKEPVVTTEKGESLEVVKERNRHEERMEEVRAEREYKLDITKIASEIPERIGRGIAGQIGEEESGGGSSDEGLGFIPCECGQKIYITPETGSQVKCPKCGSIYTREETTRTEKE